MMRLLGDLLAMIVNTESACTQMINALLVAHETFGALGSCMEWLLQHLRIFDADVDLNTVLAGWHAGNCTFQQEKEMLRDCLSRKSGNASNGGKDSDPMADAQLLRADAFDDLLDIYIAFLTLVEKVRFLASNDSANEKFWEAISPLNQQYHEYLLQTHIGGVEIVNTGPTATQPWPGGPRLEKCYFRVPKLVYRHWNVPQMRRIRKLLFRQMPRQRSETEKLRLFVRLSLRLMNTLIKLDQCEGSADDWVLRSSWLWAHGTAFLAVLINLLLLIQDWLSRSNDGAASVADLDALKRIILVISILHAVFFSVWIYSGSLLKASEDTIVLDVLRGLRNDDKLSDRGDLYNLKRSPWTLGSDVDASGRSLPVGGGTNKASSIGRLLRPVPVPKPWQCARSSSFAPHFAQPRDCACLHCRSRACQSPRHVRAVDGTSRRLPVEDFACRRDVHLHGVEPLLAARDCGRRLPVYRPAQSICYAAVHVRSIAPMLGWQGD
jgi:hypothetical protein